MTAVTVVTSVMAVTVVTNVYIHACIQSHTWGWIRPEQRSILQVSKINHIKNILLLFINSTHPSCSNLAKDMIAINSMNNWNYPL